MKYQLRKTQTELRNRNLESEDKINDEITSIKNDEDNVDDAQENEEIAKVRVLFNQLAYRYLLGCSSIPSRVIPKI